MTYQESAEAYIEARRAYENERDRMREAGPLLAEWRRSKKISLRALAQELNVSPSWLCKVERKREMMSVDTATALLSIMRTIFP